LIKGKEYPTIAFQVTAPSISFIKDDEGRETTELVTKTEYRQQIKTFRLKYIFLAGKIIRTARSVVMKLSEKYPYQEIYEKSLS